MKTPTLLGYVKNWIIGTFHRLKLSRLGHHHIIKLFADDEYPNPEGCLYCGIGWPWWEEEDERGEL